MKTKSVLLFFACLAILQLGIYIIQDKPIVEMIKIEEYTQTQPLLTQEEKKFKSFFEYLDKELILLKNSAYFKDFIKEDIYAVEVEDLFLHILKEIPELYQLRYIDKHGNEIIRAERNNNSTYLLPKNKLQNKKHRYYFKNIMNSKENKMWLSKIDDNIENGIVDFPKKRTLRIGIPVLVDQTKKGILIANVRMEQFHLEDGEFLQSFRADVLNNIYIAF